METRSRNLIRENASRNVPANYPGSGQRPGTRRSFRTPVQTLPLSVQKSASKSFVVLANQEEKETPKTLIAGFIESAETKPVVTRTLRRRSERISGSPNPNAAFKSPRMSDVLKKKLRKKDPQVTNASVASPGSKYTPRTNIRNFLATTEQEQTPLVRDSENKYQLSDFLPSGTKKRRSGWGQKLSISPLHVSHSNMEGGFQEEEIVQNFVEKKSKRKFHLKRTTEYNEAELSDDRLAQRLVNPTLESKESLEKLGLSSDDRPAQRLVNPTLESKESLEELGLPENSESEDDSLETPEINDREVEETDKLFFHQSLRSKNMRQESSIEQQITTVVQDLGKQGSLSKTYLHGGSDDPSDMFLLQRSNAVSNSQNNAYPQLRVSLDRHEVLSSNEAGHSVEHVLLQSEVNLTSQKFRQVNTSHRHDSPVKEVPDFMSVAGRPGHLLEDQATRSSEQIFTSSESPHAAAVEEDIEEPLIPFKDNVTLRDNDVVSERVDHIPSDFQGQEMEASSAIPYSKSRTFIRNLSLLKSAPSETDPILTVPVHSEYDLMESSSDNEHESRISKTLLTPKSKKKNSSRSTSSHITKEDLAEKFNTLLGSPGSPYRIVRQNNADFRIIGQRSSTPVIRNKSFFHSTKVQELLPFELTHNQTHLMENDIQNISPIRPDFRAQRQRNFNAELLDEAEMETVTIHAEDAHVERVGTSLSRQEDRRKNYLGEKTNGSAGEGAVINKTNYREQTIQNIAPATTEQQNAEYSKKNDDDKQQKTIQRTNRKRALESDDDDDELPSGISSLNTPHFTMTKQPQVPSTQRQPKMKQTTLTAQVGLSKATTDQAQQTNAKAGRVKATRGKGTKNQTMHLTLPRNSVKFFAERHSSMKLSKDAVDEIVKVSETYWSDTWKALEAYALHAGRKKINEEDVILLMKTQRTITGITDLHDKIREYLPMELRTELIPLKL